MIEEYISIKEHINLTVLKVDDVAITTTSNHLGYVGNWDLFQDLEVEL